MSSAPQTMRFASISGVTSSSAHKLERARELGAWAGIDYRAEPKVHRRVKELTGGRGVDMVVDSVGEAAWRPGIEALVKGGRLVTCGATSGGDPPAAIHRIFWKQISILGSTMGSPEEFRRVMRLVFEGRLAPVIHDVLPLEEARRAHELLEAGEVFGKLLLKP